MKKKVFIVLILLFLLIPTCVFASNSKNNDITNFIDIPAIFADFLLYLIFYFSIPVILILIKFTWNSKKEVLLFILAYNTYSFLFLSMLNLLSTTLNIFDIITPFISGFINYFLLIQYVEEPIYTTENISQKQEELNESVPMKWLNFTKYFRLPASILVTFVYSVEFLTNALQKSTINNIYIFFSIVAQFILLALLCINLYCFIYQCKEGYRLTLIMLCIQTIDNIVSTFDNLNSMNPITFFISFCFMFAIMAIIWIYPNYIYFKKRRFYFDINNNEDDIE